MEIRDKGVRGSRNGARKASAKRWCKGEEGREHTPAVVLDKTWNKVCRETGHYSAGSWSTSGHWTCHHIEVCITCGRLLRSEVECPDIPQGFVERGGRR